MSATPAALSGRRVYVMHAITYGTLALGSCILVVLLAVRSATKPVEKRLDLPSVGTVMILPPLDQDQCERRPDG